MDDSHISDSHLERYVSGLIHDETEVRWVEDHLYQCENCTERMWAIQEALDDPETSTVQTEAPELYRKGRPLQ